MALTIKAEQVPEQLDKKRRLIKRKVEKGVSTDGIEGELATVATTHGSVVAHGPKIVGSLWVGNIPINHATNESLKAAWTEAGMSGVEKCTLRVKPEKKNGSWALLGFTDSAMMQAAAKQSIVLNDEEGEPVTLRVEVPSTKEKQGSANTIYANHTPTLDLSLWVGSIPLRYADDKALRALLRENGIMGVTKATSIFASNPPVACDFSGLFWTDCL